LSLKIILADDHKIIRVGLQALIEEHPKMQVIAVAENGRKAVALTRKLNPDVVIMDISMPDLNGIEATRQILSEFPDIKVIALSMHADRRFVTRMFKSGASGYLLKDCAFEELYDAISFVTKNQTYLSPAISGFVVDGFLKKQAVTEKDLSVELTVRECEVLQLIAEGQPTKKIAAHLNLSIKTVETHRRNIMQKIDVHSIAELTKFAVREGLTTLWLEYEYERCCKWVIYMPLQIDPV